MEENLWNILWKLWNYSLLANILPSYNLLSWNKQGLLNIFTNEVKITQSEFLQSDGILQFSLVLLSTQNILLSLLIFYASLFEEILRQSGRRFELIQHSD